MEMPSLTSLSLQVAGPYLTQYEVYYKRLDPKEENEIGAVEAATFLKKSGLSDDILAKVCLCHSCATLIGSDNGALLSHLLRKRNRAINDNARSSCYTFII